MLFHAKKLGGVALLQACFRCHAEVVVCWQKKKEVSEYPNTLHTWKGMPQRNGRLSGVGLAHCEPDTC